MHPDFAQFLSLYFLAVATALPCAFVWGARARILAAGHSVRQVTQARIARQAFRVSAWTGLAFWVVYIIGHFSAPPASLLRLATDIAGDGGIVLAFIPVGAVLYDQLADSVATQLVACFTIVTTIGAVAVCAMGNSIVYPAAFLLCGMAMYAAGSFAACFMLSRRLAA